EGPRARTHRLSRDPRWRGGVPLLAVRRGPRPVVAPALRGLRRTAPAPRRAPCARAPVSDRVYDAVLFDLFGTLITFDTTVLPEIVIDGRPVRSTLGRWSDLIEQRL